MAKVTKLSIETLQGEGEVDAVFAPGLSNLSRMGAVQVTWNDEVSLADQLDTLLGRHAGCA